MERNVSVAERARELYHEHLKQTLEASSFGQFVAIEVESGEYFLGSTPLMAIKNAQKKYATKSFHVMKIGYNAALRMKLDLLYLTPFPGKVVNLYSPKYNNYNCSVKQYERKSENEKYN